MARAFLIGAGATRAQYGKAPLSADFLQLLRDRKQTLYSALAQSAKELPINTRYGEEFLRYNIEDLVRMSADLPVSVGITFFDCLYKALYHLLAEPTRSTAESIANYIKTGDIHGARTHFYNLLNDPDFDPDKDFFITLNYDLCLEREIMALGRSLFYAAGGFFRPNEALTLENIDHIPMSENGISVFHLHGALNWEIRKDSIIPHRGAIVPKYLQSKLNLCLIAPGQKYISKYLQPIWDEAKASLFRKDPPIKELVIIGCSLNPKDTELIQLIQDYVKHAGTENVKIIYFEKQPEDSEFKNYTKIVGHGFKKYSHGFDVMGPDGGAIEFIFRS